MIKVAITAGYNKSKHAIALVHEISALPDFELVVVLQVRTFTMKRIKQLIRMHGASNAWKKFKNIFISSKNNQFEKELLPIHNFLEIRKISSATLSDAARYTHAKIVKVTSLNDARSLSAVKSNQVDLIVYAGGGILRKGLIESVKMGILNAHSGPLPYFRGMNCLEWSLLYNVRPEVTIHLIDGGIDTGPILKRFPSQIEPNDSIELLRGKSVVIEVKALLEVLLDISGYLVARQTQSKEQGVQFFAMHPFIKNIISRRLQNGVLPKYSFSEFQKQEAGK